MANADIIRRILNLCSRYKNNQISAIRFESELEHHVSALEGIGSAEINKSRDFSVRLVRASFSDSEYPGENPSEVLSELKSWLSSLTA
jgi:hypothetical protein